MVKSAINKNHSQNNNETIQNKTIRNKNDEIFVYISWLKFHHVSWEICMFYILVVQAETIERYQGIVQLML